MHRWARRSLYFIAAYIVLVTAIVFHPTTLRGAAFLHWINFPRPHWLKHPVYYGYGVYGARHLFLNTTDQQTIGAWHVLSPQLQLLSDGEKEAGLVKADLVYLYLHGNAANRAAPLRSNYDRYLAADTERNVHVLSIDYRGFGDSSGSPSELGVQLDVDAAYTYLLRHVKDASKIVVLGHSLGTAVGTLFLHRLTHPKTATPPLSIPKKLFKGTPPLPKGLVLVAPFTSIVHVAVTYPLVPFLWPLKYLHAVSLLDALTAYISDGFMSSKYLGELPKTFPVLIFHGRSDREIPVGHGYRLFLDASRKSTAPENQATKDLVFAAPPPMHQSASELLMSAWEEEDTVDVQVLQREAYKYTMPSTVVTMIEPLYAGHNNIALFDVVLTSLRDWTSAL